MDLEELRGFLTVVETGSLLGASTRLEIPRATLRRRVDALEARVGVPLLNRNARGMTVTEAGSVLAERGRRLLDEGAALLTAVREFGRESAQPLRLHVPVGLPPSLLVAFMKLGRASTSNFRISLHVRDDPLTGLQDDVDVAVQLGDRAPPAPWLMNELSRIPVRILASPAYLAQAGRPQQVADLSAHPLASWIGAGLCEDRWPLRAGGSVEVTPTLVSNDPHMLRQQVHAGVALALLPNAALDLFGLPMDELVPVLDDLVGGSVLLSLCIPESFADNLDIVRIVELIRQFLSRSHEAP